MATPISKVDKEILAADIVAILGNHHHNSQLIYGKHASSANYMVRSSVVPLTVTGGNNAWGVETQIYEGTFIGDGSATKYFDLNKIFITTVSTADKISLIRFNQNIPGADVNCTFTDVGDVVTTVADHGLANGTLVMVKSIVATTGLTTELIYTVANVTAKTFTLTSGGAAVTMTTNGSGVFYTLTQSLMSEIAVSKTSQTANMQTDDMMCPRVPCNSRISVIAKSVTGSTIAIGFLVGLHVYES